MTRPSTENPPTDVRKAMIYITSLTRQWFEKMLPGYYINVKFAHLQQALADSDYIDRQAKVVNIRFSFPMIIANVHNIKSDVFRKLVIHELAHIPEIQQVKYEQKHGVTSPFVKRALKAHQQLEKARLLRGSLRQREEADASEKFQRLYHTYKPYRERVKQYGGSESIADRVSRVKFAAYRGSKSSIVPEEIHQILLASCPKCHRIGVIYKHDTKPPGVVIKNGIRYCKKCKEQLRVRKLTPDEVVNVSKLPMSSKKEYGGAIRKLFPRFFRNT